MTAEQSYNQNLLEEIKLLQKEIEEKIQQSDEMTKIYKGWKVWFSPIIENTPIMFIGINPGSGEDGNVNFEPDGVLQYTYDTSRWPLKNDTIEVFNDSFLKDKVDLEDCVKINYYYLATENIKKFYPLIDFLGRQEDFKGLGDIFLSKSKIWTKQIIKIIKPQVIICEGATAFDLVNKYALNSDVNKISEDAFCYYNSDLNINIVGYKRTHPNGGIKNKKLLIETLRSIL